MIAPIAKYYEETDNPRILLNLTKVSRVRDRSDQGGWGRGKRSMSGSPKVNGSNDILTGADELQVFINLGSYSPATTG